ncbi:MAG: type VI secretion system contractile sheath domain-containing protein, partial [Pseudomonadales bacterium]
RDLNTSVSVERSCLYNFIGNRELNTLGGEPFGLFVVERAISMEMDVDDEFDDLYTLELLARLGELCLCPFTLSVADDFFGDTGFSWLSDIARMQKILQGPDYIGWRRLRQQPQMKFIALTLPKLKLRPRYRGERIGFVFDEEKSATDGVWGSAAFAFASTAIREFSRLGWFGFMKSRWQHEYQGAVINTAPGVDADYVLRQPEPEMSLISPLARFYAEQGFIPVCPSPMTDKFFFFGNSSLWQAERGEEDSAGSQIQSILMSCRIAHYLKVQIRNMIGSFHTAAECQKFLSDWIDDYSSHLVDADEKTLAKYPLSKGRVRVREREDSSGGRFVCELTIQPQYQFDHFCGEIVLSTDLGKLKRAPGDA